MKLKQAYSTDQISNQIDELSDYNLFESDQVLQEILLRYGSQEQPLLSQFASLVGSAQYYN